MAKTPPAWAQFEDRISKQCVRYFRDGVAKIHKVDPPTKVIGRRIIFLENPFLDYIGVVQCSGRFITFEAKRTERPYLALGGPRGLTARQSNHLDAWASFSALTGVLWEHSGEVRWVSAAMLAVASRLKQKHLKFDHDATLVPQTPYPDFLPVALEG